jgi:hypothetical protein
METSAIRIEAESERNIRTVVLRDDTAGAFEDILRARMLERTTIVLVEGVEIDLAPELGEAIGRFDMRAAAVRCWSIWHGWGRRPVGL